MKNRTPFQLLMGSVAGALPVAAFPQISTQSQAVYVEVAPFTVLDHDGDGVDELLAIPGGGSGVNAYTVAPDGSLVFEKRLIDVADDVRELALADMDGDGLADLVGVRESPNGVVSLVVAYDRGGTRFENAQSVVQAVRDLDGLTTTDFDQDGDMDIVLYPASVDLAASSFGGGTIVVALNRGGGAFDHPVDVQSFAEPLRSAAPVDLGQNGDLDFVALRNGSGTLVVARRQGGVLQIQAVGTSPMSYQDLAVGDVDGNGFSDVVAFRQAAPGAPADLDFYRGNAGGGFDPRVTVLAGAIGLAPDVSLLDIDGDGDLDLAVASVGATPDATAGVRVLAGNGLGGFSMSGEFGLVDGSLSGRSRVGDFDGDGRGDLLGRVEIEALVADSFGVIRLGEAGPALGGAIEVGRFEVGTDVLAGDIDGDGIQDLLNQARGEVFWFRGAPGELEAPASVGLAEEVVLVANFDGDAADEILVRTATGFGLIDSLGVGLFSSVLPLDLGSTTPARGILPSDIDGDGDLDLLVVPAGGTGLASITNLGGLQFGAQVPVPLAGGQGGSFFQVGDFNGDGVVDLHTLIFGVPFFTSFSQGWYEGLGGGQFGPQQFVGISSTNRVILDLDGDGFDDVVWAGSDQPPGIYLATGGPIGTLPTDGDLLVATQGGQFPLGSMDFNGDGLGDLLTYRSNGQVFGYPRLAGSGLAFGMTGIQLAPALTNASGSPVSGASVLLTDLRGDGDLDLVVSSSEAGIFWYEGGNLDSVGTTFCGPGIANSTGVAGQIMAMGTDWVAANDITLSATNLPPLAFGFFITSQTQSPATPVIGSAGRICLGGSVGRYVGPGQVQQSGTNGSFQLAIDLTAIPTPLGFVSAMPGSSWSFQAWHRDSSIVGPLSNFTDGLEIMFQ
ncbi:FG-GAP repeat protein [Planctomycetes bacterium Poly30]|uniref:FG-GAP repeat protein n=1 Tax=Saltatorellus ferox TaxID=2528018 RepID=A0A518EQK6_9BACT|nr:FG-GAP repeat protein [Planctomycetes bacterium Poly30]